MPFGNLVQEAASAQLKEFNGVYLRNYSPENRKVHKGQAALALKQLKQLHARCAVCTHCSRKNSTYIPLKSIDKILACGKASGLGGCALGAREGRRSPTRSPLNEVMDRGGVFTWYYQARIDLVIYLALARMLGSSPVLWSSLDVPQS